jgi:lipoprotein-anchoring transpeptidase ErfK/SrfK
MTHRINSRRIHSRRVDRSLALAAFAGFVITCAPAVATAQSYAPMSAGYANSRYVNSAFAPVLHDDDAAAGAVESPRFQRQLVSYATHEAPGTIVIDTPNTYLYLVLGGGKALRYGIGVGREGFTWSGTETISRVAEWPDWYPPAEMIARQPYLPRFVAGGPSNPLGARALYLGHSQYRIHGTNDPSTIGHNVSSGCIRLTNADVIDLFGRVKVGTKVVVLPQTARRTQPAAAPVTRAHSTYAPTAYAPPPSIVPVETASTRSTSGFAFGLH